MVSKHVAEIMLGMDFLRNHGVVWNFPKNEVIIDGYFYKLQPTKPLRWLRRVELEEDIEIPARSK